MVSLICIVFEAELVHVVSALRFVDVTVRDPRVSLRRTSRSANSYL
jgi:hypothetical protein